MIRVITFFLFFILILTSSAQDRHEFCIKAGVDRYQSSTSLNKINYPGDSRFDVTYYKLDLKLTHTPNYLSGNVTIGAKADSNSLNSIFLDLSNVLVVDSVKQNGLLRPFTHLSNKINVTLDRTYQSGEHFSVIVYYRGTPTSSGFGSFAFSSHSGQPAIWTLSEPYGTIDWWPCKDTPADKADSADIWITVATNLIPASNGKLMEIVQNGDGTHTYRWKSSYPIAQYLISLAITNYTQYTNYYHYSATDSMPIDHFIYPESFNSFKSQLDKTPNMMSIFVRYFGEYPFLQEKYGHAQFGWGGGMEHQTISSMGGFSDGLMAHELAHQWYGDMITCKDWHHIWLNEGFATYAEGVYIEAVSGRNAYNNYINSEMSSARTASGSIWVQNISSVNQIFNGARSYAKGGVVLHMLRGIVGDSTFYDILRTYSYHPDVSYDVAVTEDFQAIAESLYGSSLDYFFQQWIYGENYPRYTFSWGNSSLGGGLYNLQLNVNQQVNSNPSYFTMPIQVRVQTASGDTIVTVVNNQQSQSFNVQISSEPTAVTFDPNNYILKSLTIVSDVDEPNILNSFSLEQNFPNPFNPSTKIKYTIPAVISTEGRNLNVTLKAYDVLGNEVATLVNDYKPAGEYEVEFNASQLTSGVYFYTLTAGNYSESKKMVLLK